MALLFNYGSTAYLALRTASVCSRRRANRLLTALSPSYAIAQRRAYSEGFHPSIKSAMAQVDALHVPKFSMPEGAVQVLTEPAQFYETLKQKIETAQRRVFLATLYVGKTEHELVACLAGALRRNKDLKVYILADALRGTREAPKAPCSASLLAPLVTEFGNDRVQLQLYHTPELDGLKKKMIPNRFNEGWGLQHMKLYGVDDEIILSGANLSNDYFTNRQDRYILFKSAPLTDYYFKLHRAVASLSYTIVPWVAAPKQETVWDKLKATARQTVFDKTPEPTFTLEWTQGPYIPEPIDNPDLFVQHASQVLSPLLRAKPSAVDQAEANHDYATVVYPISQFSPLLQPNDTSTEFPVVSRLLSMLSSAAAGDLNWVLTAGYFNMHPAYTSKLLQSSPKEAKVICAAPTANGFYESAGVSGLLPGAYSLLASQFVAAVDKSKAGRHSRSGGIEVVEWERGVVNKPGGWSFHAKGIWISDTSSSAATNTDSGSAAKVSSLGDPCITVVGSSNYTRRAYAHDLESNALLVTKDPALKAQLREEVEALLKYTGEPMTAAKYEERKPSVVLRGLTWLLGGKL